MICPNCQEEAEYVLNGYCSGCADMSMKLGTSGNQFAFVESERPKPRRFQMFARCSADRLVETCNKAEEQGFRVFQIFAGMAPAPQSTIVTNGRGPQLIPVFDILVVEP